MTEPKTFAKFGKFVIASRKELWGELHVEGKNSLLYVRTLRLLRFLKLIIGRPQNLQTIFVQVEGPNDRERLKVHWSHQSAREEEFGEGRRSPQPADMLLMRIDQPEEFGVVMQTWLKNDEERQGARGRFHTSFAMQRTYTVERLVASANVFDILPKSAVPQDVELTEDLCQAKSFL